MHLIRAFLGDLRIIPKSISLQIYIMRESRYPRIAVF